MNTNSRSNEPPSDSSDLQSMAAQIRSRFVTFGMPPDVLQLTSTRVAEAWLSAKGIQNSVEQIAESADQSAALASLIVNLQILGWDHARLLEGAKQAWRATHQGPWETRRDVEEQVAEEIRAWWREGTTLKVAAREIVRLRQAASKLSERLSSPGLSEVARSKPPDARRKVRGSVQRVDESTRRFLEMTIR